MSYAEIKNYNGAPTVMVDGKPLMPMGMTTCLHYTDYIRNLRESGIKLYWVFANTDWMRPGGEKYYNKYHDKVYEESGFELFKKEVYSLLEAAPDAYIIVRIGMHPPADWVESHPADVLTFNDGSTEPCWIVSEIHGDHLPGCYSMCSDNWRRDGAKALQDFCDKVDASDFADRVIGYFFAAGGTSEWYYVTSVTNGGKNLYGDCSPAFKSEYSKILKEKYGTQENLQKAWKRPNATFDDPYIPVVAERKHLGYEYAASPYGQYGIPTTDAEREYNYGCLLNVNKYLPTFDFFQAWSMGTANTIVHFANVIKNRYKGKLVGAFFGAWGCTDFYDVGTCSGILRVLDSGVVDFLAAPGTYNNRQPGGNVCQREMQDSFRLRNMLFVAEEDSRTHLEQDRLQSEMHFLYSAEDTVTTLKRDFARVLCEETFSWWFDQNDLGGRYMCEECYKLFARQQELAAKYAEIPQKKNNEIALIFDHESIHVASVYTDRYVNDYYRTTDLARIGAPVDYYFHNDMALDNMPDYKMYIMVNVYYLSDEERKIIDAKAAKNGATVVWLYAAGMVNPDADIVMDNKNIEDITGIHVERDDMLTYPTFKINSTQHPMLKYADTSRTYGYIDRDVRCVIDHNHEATFHFVNPLFYVNDENAEILGNYCMSGKPALATKKLDKGYTSVYCGAKVLRSDILTSIAENAGCHIFNYDDDYICANESFVMIHAKYTGKHTLHFKRECDPFEVYEKKSYGKGVISLELDMKMGDTLMFHLDGEI